VKVRFVKDLCNDYSEFEALEDGTIVTDHGDHPTFGIKELEDMKLFVRKGEHFQLSEKYLLKNTLEGETKNQSKASFITKETKK